MNKLKKFQVILTALVVLLVMWPFIAVGIIAGVIVLSLSIGWDIGYRSWWEYLDRRGRERGADR